MCTCIVPVYELVAPNPFPPAPAYPSQVVCAATPGSGPIWRLTVERGDPTTSTCSPSDHAARIALPLNDYRAFCNAMRSGPPKRLCVTCDGAVRGITMFAKAARSDASSRIVVLPDAGEQPASTELSAILQKMDGMIAILVHIVGLLGDSNRGQDRILEELADQSQGGRIRREPVGHEADQRPD